MAKISKPVWTFAIVTVFVAAYTYMGGGPVKKSSSLKPISRSSKNKKADIFTKEDYEVRFARLDAGAKDSFTPLVARSSMAGAVGPDVVPMDFAAGDPNWVFTGSTEVDGRASALFENRVTSEMEFVPLGQRWKNCTVSQIEEGTATLIGRSGKHVQLRLVDHADELTIASAQGGNGLRPVNPALSGPIGRNVAVRPETPQPAVRGRNSQEQTNAN